MSTSTQILEFCLTSAVQILCMMSEGEDWQCCIGWTHTIFLRTKNWVVGNRRQIWKEFGEGGKYDQNMFCEVLKELIETKTVKSKHLLLKDRL